MVGERRTRTENRASSVTLYFFKRSNCGCTVSISNSTRYNNAFVENSKNMINNITAKHKITFLPNYLTAVLTVLCVEQLIGFIIFFIKCKTYKV